MGAKKLSIRAKVLHEHMARAPKIMVTKTPDLLYVMTTVSCMSLPLSFTDEIESRAKACKVDIIHDDRAQKTFCDIWNEKSYTATLSPIHYASSEKDMSIIVGEKPAVVDSKLLPIFKNGEVIESRGAYKPVLIQDGCGFCFLMPVAERHEFGQKVIEFANDLAKNSSK